MDRGEPQRLSLWFEWAEITSRTDDAIIEGHLIDAVGKHGLDGGDLPLSAQLFDLSPDEFHTDRSLRYGLQREGESIEVEVCQFDVAVGHHQHSLGRQQISNERVLKPCHDPPLSVDFVYQLQPPYIKIAKRSQNIFPSIL